jgi:hypothetical protein
VPDNKLENIFIGLVYYISRNGKKSHKVGLNSKKYLKNSPDTPHRLNADLRFLETGSAQG